MKKSKLLMVALLSSTIALTACQKKEETPTTGEAQPAPQQQVQQPQQATETKQEVKEEAKPQEQKPETQKDKLKEEIKRQRARVDDEVIKSCAACHQPNADTVGPGLNKIASAYKGNKDGLVKFLSGEGKAIVDPAKEAIMESIVEATKKLSKEDREALAEFILKH